ncbi:S8 family peptidase [Paenibacillus herberti]|uniref:Peptidase S8 n=1 Tax=Paenibacillus herberti TaxID=1619309 RepID=A0A229P437_9BACL|nr:S8 family peptidase [Paenibacillus herberti]OXM16714.1 peptidase S8 [Paenibacillus herberti]
MKSIGKCLCECAANSPGKHTKKHIISLRSRKAYDEAIKELKLAGIKPAHAWRGSCIICLHLDQRISLKELHRHHHVSSLEKDVIMRALGASPKGSRKSLVSCESCESFESNKSRSSERSRSSCKTRKSHVSCESCKFRKPCRSCHKPLARQQRSRSRQIAARVQSSKGCGSRIPWNIQRVGAPAAWKKTLGRGIRLAVIDTGIGPHPNLTVAGGANVISGSSYRDDNGHGTHVSGIAAGRGRSGGPLGVAPGVSLYAVKALDNKGLGSLSSILDGLEWCIKNRMKVVNMSLGTDSGTKSPALQRVVKRAHKNGIVLVAAAGNSGKNSGGIDIPAVYPETIAVAASGRSNQIAEFSSRGKGIELTAPGDSICSCWLNDGYKTESGTSMSTPHVAGGAALLLAANPGMKGSQVAPMLKRWTRKLPNYNSSSQGQGLLQLSKTATAFNPVK